MEIGERDGERREGWRQERGMERGERVGDREREGERGLSDGERREGWREGREREIIGSISPKIRNS